MAFTVKPPRDGDMSSDKHVVPALRQFSFFTLKTVHDITDEDATPDIFKKTLEISTTATGQSSILIADIHGLLHLIAAPDFTVTQSWVAHEHGRVTHAAFSSLRGIILTIGEEEGSSFPLVKIWSLSSKRFTLEPRLLAAGPLTSPQPHPVSALAITGNLSHVAIGLADGTVLLLRHLDSYLNPSNAPATIPKPRIIQQTKVEPITGLAFSSTTTSDKKSTLVLFAVTTNRVLTYPANGKSTTPHILDEIGAGVGCSTIDSEGKMILARQEAIYIYNSEARETSIAYEGSKSSIHLYSNYLVIISPPFVPTAASQSATVRNFVAKNKDWSSGNDIARVGIFDLNQKFIAHSSAFEEGVRDVFVQWGKIWILGHDGKLTRIEEISTSAKLDIFFDKSLFLLAIGLAESLPGFDEKELSEIHRRYGDFLYSKGDFDGAVEQYLQTIGFVEPSFVIRKFLDAQRIHNLTSFLEALHTKGLANSSHTSLLLNCFTKLKDNARLDAFLKSSALDSTDGMPPFDLDTALRVTRQAGYYDHAVQLAKRYGRAEEYVKIQIEDREDWKEATHYIRGMGLKSAEAELLSYGKLLLKHLPDETTQLLIDLCCGTLDIQPVSDALASPAATLQRQSSTAGYLTYLPYPGSGGSNQKATASAAPSLTNAVPQASPPLVNGNAARRRAMNHSESAATITSEVNGDMEDLPSPQIFFAHFIEHKRHFVHFLEVVLEKRFINSRGSGDSKEKTAICNTLLEIYVALIDQDASYRDQAMTLLKSPNEYPYEPLQTLLVCINADFAEGFLYLYESMEMVEEVFRYHMARSDVERTLQVLWKHGARYPKLYQIALRWLSEDSARMSKHVKDVEKILEDIDENKLMKPIEVVKLLGRNESTTIGTLKNYLNRNLTAEKEEIDADRALIESYGNEVQAKRREITALMNSEAPQVFQVSRCSACGGNLELPAIHFMCKHSFHQRCLQDSTLSTAVQDCPLCAHDFGLVKEIKRGNERLWGRHDLFLEEVKESEDPFSVIAAHFGKGQIR